MKASFGLWAAFLLFGFQTANSQATSWLTDEQARVIAATAVNTIRNEPCHSTYRKEGLEDWVVSLRKNPIVDNQLNRSVYFYRVADDVCDYVVEQGGKPVLMSKITMDCCEYGIVAVDRGTSKSYWFTGEKKADLFKEFARDEQIHPDFPEPTLFTALYRELVWGESNDNEIQSQEQLKDAVRQNFQSAYILDQHNNAGEKKFNHWWRQFRSSMSQLNLETTYELTSEGTEVHGFAFNGFELTSPSTSPPLKGMPKLFQWTLLVKSNGTVERLPSKVIYSAR